VTWKAYQVVFKLKSPLHIGCGKVGNVQKTRPYIMGRSFWGALTMRLTREQHKPATDSRHYETIGEKVHQELAYTYFYPAISQGTKYNFEYHWGEFESQFRRRFLSSYSSTALVYPQQAADEGLLHEVEFISPRTLDTGKQVYLIGYVFEKENCSLKWQEACQKLQMGGERGYGWGDMQYINIKEITVNQLFDGKCEWKEQDGLIIIQVSESENLLAHTVAQNTSIYGEIEPLVGREWRSYNTTNRYAGQHLEKFCDSCWVPGSQVRQLSAFVIQKFGIWQTREFV